MHREINHLTTEELEQKLDYLTEAPKNKGLLKKICIRPDINQRQALEFGFLNSDSGLKGDNWKHRGSSKTEDGSSHPDVQITLMNSRVAEVLAQTEERWFLAGDQLFVDMDLSEENLPPGSKISIGNAILEIAAIPHNGCKKFMERFGLDALKFVNSDLGKKLHFRGLNAKVIQDGEIQIGNIIQKL